MTTIGIYDSGAGGLTVLAEILKNFAGNAVYYYADNAHAPFGALDDDELSDCVADGLAQVQLHSDITVVACNTASTFLRKLARGTIYENELQIDVFMIQKCHDKPSIKPIIGILPPLFAGSGLAPFLFSPAKTLLLATEATKRFVSPPEDMKIACTPELASLIENELSNNGDMASLLPYLHEKLDKFIGIKSVVLGCTHYPFCKRQISKILGNVKFLSGAPALINAMKNFVSPNIELAAPINFAFSGNDESAKYSRVIESLVSDNWQI